MPGWYHYIDVCYKPSKKYHEFQVQKVEIWDDKVSPNKMSFTIDDDQPVTHP